MAGPGHRAFRPMHRITPDAPHALFDTAATRRIERAALEALPPGTLMERAGRAVARLALALAPHARRTWIACGAGNNGGDGLEAALHLHRQGRAVQVTWLGTLGKAPRDARRAWERAVAAGVPFTGGPPPGLGPGDLCIDALLGIGLAPRPGAGQPPDARLAALLAVLRESPAPLLCVDGPSGLLADTGQYLPGLEPSPTTTAPAARHTLALLTAKPGWFTGLGRDAAGTVWLDDLGVEADAHGETATARLAAPAQRPPRAHASHKGSHGDVAVVGGEAKSARGMGMTGAALLAASAALHGGAGRVMVALLEGDGDGLAVDPAQPECMLRRFEALPLGDATVVCGCGGGEAVRGVLPRVLAAAPRLVLDADGLNAVAADAALAAQLRARGHGGLPSVLTPHPLEAARLLGTTTAAVQADRLGAARRLAEHSGCTVVLKGSGSIVAAPDGAAWINPTGNARLATGGTGDVLAGLLGAYWAARGSAPQAGLEAALAACHAHGLAADRWPEGETLTASALARRLAPG
ncbi:Bifunctional NAD(P)H-hydrate repair enzyme [Paracidovorax anthurii]|uniref:Bifunctional NAD(P)H-hydrate repair enzyme n=2 Tax=Paracidovorax anthurii TaxID=78229 RepID=A0A328ZH61_9BURK|nr:hydroxyethylthiazole kinase-like uncharacterized protein yjeF/hydroxyethylthiazole kinase-like uncharacterized protein yjeF [Paracidovorax anthurii]